MLNTDSLFSCPAGWGKMIDKLVYHDVVLERRIGKFEKGTKFPLVVIEPFEGKLYLCEKDFSYAAWGDLPYPNHEFDLKVSL